MDIPLPDDPPTKKNVEESLSDIPVPEDANRYSPSLPIEDDPTEPSDDISMITLPSDPLSVPVQTTTVSVLGKEAAKKRLLAFSQTKFSLISQKRKASLTAVDSSFTKESEAKSILARKKKKGVLDKARDTISEIEELKRRENEVMETMQVLFPMWSNSDKKSTPVTSLIIHDGVVEKSENVVEKLFLKKMKHERRDYEKKERSEERERRRKKERKEKEIRRLMPKSWTEFNRSRFKAYHFRRQKFKLEQLGEGTKSKERNRSHEHEREGSKKINLLDTPMVLKKPIVVSSKNNEDIEFPSWAVRYTNAWPPISYCINPKYEPKHYMSRKEMFNTLPDNIYSIVKKFLSSSSLNKFEKQKVQTSRSWWERDSFLIPGTYVEHENQSNFIESIDNSIHETILDSTYNELNNYNEENESEKLDNNSPKLDSPLLSSEGPASEIEKSCNSETSETEMVGDFGCKSLSPCKDDNTNDGNLASEYEQFIKTIGPNTDSKEITVTTEAENDDWSKVVGENQEPNSFSVVKTNKKKKHEVVNSKKLKEKKSSQKKKGIKKKVSKRSHSTDSSSSETSSKSSSSSRSTSSSSRSSSSSSSSSTSSSASSSSSSSSSSDSSSSSSSNDSSSESSTTSTSSGSSSSSDSQTHKKTSKKLKRKQVSAKKLISNKRNKSKKASKEDNEENLEIKINMKNEEHIVKTLGHMESGSEEEEAADISKSCDSPHESLQEILEGNKFERYDTINNINVEKKKSLIKEYNSKDYSPQSRTTDEDCSNLSNTSLKSIISETVIINEQKEANNSLDWNSAEDSASNVPVVQDTGVDNKDSPLEGKRHFNLDIFQESYNCTSDVSSPHGSQIIAKDLGVPSPQNNSKSKEENDNNSISITNTGEESVLKSLEKYSPTAEDEDEEEDYFANASVGGSTLDEASRSQLVSFGVNSASEEARMLDIPLPPPIETQSDAPPTSFHNILQLPGSPTNNSVQMDVKKKNMVLIGKLPVARLTFGKQVMKLKPMSIFSTEDSDSEVLPEKTPLPRVSGMHDGSSLQSSNDILDSKEIHCDVSGIKAQENVKITNEELNEEVVLAKVVGNSVIDMKPANIGLDSPPLSKKSRWDQEALKNEDGKINIEHMETSQFGTQQPFDNSMVEKYSSNEKQFSDNQALINIPEVHNENVKEKCRKEPSRSPIVNDKKKRRERSHSLERDRKRRERIGSPRYRGRFSRDRRRDFRKRSRSRDRRSRKDSPHLEYSPNWKKNSPQNKSTRRSLSIEGELKKTFEQSHRPENVSNHELPYEPPTSFDSSWNKVNVNLSEMKESYNSSPKKKESLSDWESPERKYLSPQHKESPKRKKSPLHESPFRSPRNSPIKRKSPDHYRRKESPNRRYSPRRSPVDRQSWKRLSPDRKRSPYSPRRSSPSRRRVSPDRKRTGSPYRRRLSPSPERKYSRYSRKSPVKRRSYSISPNREEKWKWDEETGTEKNKMVDNEHFSKWDYDHSQNDLVSDYQTSLADSTISDSELVKEPVPASPKRMSLDERLKIELGHTSTNIEPEQPQSIPLYHNFYYPPPAAPERVNFYPSQPYVNPQPPPSCLPPDWNPSVHPPQLPNKLVQVGNVLQVVPTEIPIEPVFSAPPPKVIRSMEILPPKVLQVGNMLQVVPSQEHPPPPPKQNVTLQFNTIVATSPSPVAAPVLKLTVPPPPPPQTSAPQPVSIISLPFPPGSPSVFTKLEEKDRRKKEKELRKQRKEEKAARRMLRKAILKKKLAEANEGENEVNTDTVEVMQNEGELDSTKSSVTLPSPDKGILISIKDIPITTPTKKKSVSFADGIKPGEGTSPSGGEEHPLSPPPLIRKPVKKRKKRKVKVRIIRIDNNPKEEESEEDDLSPPPPPPGTPPPEAYIEYTASGRYLYPVPNPQPFSGNQDGATVFPAHPAVTTNPNPAVKFSTPPPPQQR